MFRFGPRRHCGSIGLHIAKDAVKLIQLGYHQGRLSVIQAKRVSLPDHVDEPQRRQAQVTAVQAALDEGGFHGRQVVSCLPNDALKVTSVRLDEADAAKIGAELNKEAAYRFGLNPEVDSIRYIPAGKLCHGGQVKQEMILFGVEDTRIRGHIALLEEAGLVPVGIDPLPCALFRGLTRQMRRQEDREQAAMYVHVGCRHATVVFGIQGEICLIKQIPTGTMHFDQEIAAKLATSTEEARSMRLSLQEASRMRPTLSGPDRSAEHDGDVARQTDAPTDGGEPPDLDQTTRQVLLDAMNSVAEQLIHEISLCLRYYTVTFRGQRVGSALVSGVGAETPLLLDTCKRHLPCDVAVAQSFRGLRKVGRLPRERQTEWAIAIGLALKGIESAAPEQEDVPRTSQLISVG